jgi:hypothetical protein
MTDKDINNTLKKLSDEIDVLRNQARNKGLAFSSPTAEQLEKKLKSAHTPFIYSMAWTSSGSAIGPFTYYVYVTNPDPNAYFDLFAYFFFGPANMVPDVGTALLSVDERLPRMFASFPYMSPGSNGSVQFNYKFSSGIPAGLYMGNAFIFLREVHDVGAYADRGCINVEIS